jgi:hypothetical protein
MYNFELSVDAALAGNPRESDRTWMIDAAARNARDLFDRLKSEPPAAFVTMDRVPYDLPSNADEDFARHCPEAADFIRSHYRPAKQFGTVRVWLREDRALETASRTRS